MVDFVSFEEGERRRAHRRELANREYVLKRTPGEYLRWITEHADTFHLRSVHPQDRNNEEAYCLFTVASQHVHGDSVEECIDKAIEAAARRKAFFG